MWKEIVIMNLWIEISSVKEPWRTHDLLCERCQDPWKTSGRELVLLDVERLLQRASEHRGSKDL